MAINSPPNVTSAPNTEWMHSTFAFLQLHDVILILAIIILFAALGGGPLLRASVNWFLRLIGRGVSETIVNVGIQGGDMTKDPMTPCAGCGALVDPSKCIMHQAEHERSLENKRQIEAMWDHLKDLGNEMRAGFKDVSKTLEVNSANITATIVTNQKMILAALSGERPGHGGMGRGGAD